MGKTIKGFLVNQPFDVDSCLGSRTISIVRKTNINEVRGS